MSKLVQVGVGMIIIRDNTVLFGLRNNTHRKGSWSLPGEHLDLATFF